MPRRPPGPSMSAIHTSPAKSIGLVPSLSTTTTMTTVSSSSPPGLGMSPSPPTIGGQDRHANENSPRVPPVKKDRRVRAGLSAKPVAVSTTASSNPSATSFDVRSILPDTRPRKSLSKLLEASSSVNKQPTLQPVPFQCIDGAVRTNATNICDSDTYDPLSAENVLTARYDQFLASAATSTTSGSGTREQFRAYGIEAFPTRAILNDICYDFVSYRRWCPHGSRCSRIHPLDKKAYLPIAIQEQVRFEHMKATAGSAKCNGSNILPGDAANCAPEMHPGNAQISSISVDNPIRVKLPALASSADVAKTMASSPPLAQNSKPTTKPPSHHRPTQPLPADCSSRSMDDVHNWDKMIGLHKSSRGHHGSSDTNGFSDDSDDEVPAHVRALYPSNPRNWEVHTEESAWSDSNDTVEETPPSSTRRAATKRKENTFETSIPPPSPPPQYPTPAPQRLPPKPSTEKDLPPAAGPEIKRHPRPRNSERCRNWLRNQCSLGYACNYIHEDLDYDDDPPEPPKQLPTIPAELPATPARPMIRRPPESYSTILHQHLRLKFGSGFEIEDIVTGFESPWVFVSGLPRDIGDAKLTRMLRPFGEILEIRRPLNPASPMTAKVQFSKASEAYKAFTTLHGAIEFGYKLELRMAVEGKQNGTLIKDTVVRIDWDAPHRNVYMGYANEEQANAAIQKARHTPYGNYLTVAALHTGVPAVGRVTVKFQNLPVNVTEEGMEVFGPHQGMVTERPNYPDYTVQDTINGIRKLCYQFHSTMIDLDFRPPPYKEGKMRAWAYFSTPNDAKAAAENLNGRKPAYTGRNRIVARHIKTISFSLSVDKFRKLAAELKVFAEKIWRHDPSHNLSVIDKTSYISLRLSGEDMKTLGRLKSRVERILNGEPLLENGKVVWDDFFGRNQGILFLQDLERQFKGVTIEKDAPRRIIRLFGVSEGRVVVREKILHKMAQLQFQKSHVIRLDPRVTATFSNDEYLLLQKQLGPDNVVLDFWRHFLRVRGDEDAFIVASEAVNRAQMKNRYNPPRMAATRNECPVCFSEASSPVQLFCGHSFCRACLKRYLMAAIDHKFFPLTCLGDEGKCTEHIPLSTARELLPVGDFDAIVNAAFSAHIQTHPDEYHFCPTPDCPQVYRAAPEGVFIQCPTCLLRICPNCHTDAHDGLTCSESSGGDDLFKDWVGKHDVKQCPGCKIAIEKDEGCNHMMCTMCKTHICWVCLQTFPNGEGIYGHMRSEHGDFGLGPII